MNYLQFNNNRTELLINGLRVEREKLHIYQDERLPYPVLEFDGAPLFDTELWDEDELVSFTPPQTQTSEAIYRAAKNQIFPSPAVLNKSNFLELREKVLNDIESIRKQMNIGTWSSYQSILSVWRLNKSDLESLLNRLHSDEALALEMIQNVRESTLRDSIHRELDRQIYNYLTSFRSVIDASRALLALYPNSQIVVKASKFREPFDGPQFRFINALRNYVVHYDLPVSGQQLNFTRGQHIEFKILADTDRLLEYSGWDGNVKTFLKSQTEPLDIGRLLFSHMRAAEKQWGWLHNIQYALHSFQIYEYNQCVNESNWALSAGTESQPRITFM